MFDELIGNSRVKAVLKRMLVSEEEHVDWLEAQLHQIKEMGYERYLSQQVRESQ